MFTLFDHYLQFILLIWIDGANKENKGQTSRKRKSEYSSENEKSPKKPRLALDGSSSESDVSFGNGSNKASTSRTKDVLDADASLSNSETKPFESNSGSEPETERIKTSEKPKQGLRTVTDPKALRKALKQQIRKQAKRMNCREMVNLLV